MDIEKVHGLQSTNMSLNERFTMLAKLTPDRIAKQQRRPYAGRAMNYNNHNLIEQIARHLEHQAKLAVKQRLGFTGGNLRRFGSEGNLPGLRRSNSLGDLSQQSIKNRVSWRNSNGNLRSGLLNNMSAGGWRGRLLRGYRRRGGGPRAVRGRFRGGRQNAGVVTRVPQRPRRGGQPRPQVARRGTAARGRGRGGITRSQQPKRLIPTKEELDAQLDQYMAGTKAALDKELDVYMKNAMELE